MSPAAARELDVVTSWVGSHSLATRGALSAVEVAGLIAATSTIVADLHRSGISHNNLDESHVLLATDGRPVLCGFSQAVVAESPTTDGHQQRAAGDVEAIGRMLVRLLGSAPAEGAPPRPRVARRDRSRGIRRSLLEVAGQTTGDPRRRLTARALATAIIDAVPHASLPDLDTTAPPPSPARLDHDLPLADQPEELRPGGTESPLEVLDALERLRETAAEPPPAPPLLTARRIAAAAGLATAGLLIVLGPQLLRIDSEGSDSTIAPHAAATDEQPRPPATDPAASASTDARGEPPSLRPAAGDAVACSGTAVETATVAVDVDGDGCLDAVHVDGNVVEVGDRRWQVGGPGDTLTLADWDCDGDATPALLRRDTGEVFVFADWVPPGDEITVQPVTSVADAALIRPTAGAECPDLVVTRRDGTAVSIPASTEALP
jgi:hypothetical protein